MKIKCIYSVSVGHTVNKTSGGEKVKGAKMNNHCGICEEEKSMGIVLYNLFICDECETNMIYTEPREEKYKYYLRKLKNISHPTLLS